MTYLQSMIEWTEKYRPATLDKVVGNKAAVADLRKWAETWEVGRGKKAVILAGGPGIGKTSAALALANDLGWGVVEMNASDTRNATSVRKVAFLGALGETFTSEGEYASSKEGRRKLIVLDEADNLFGREDAGGIGAITETIRASKQPIVLIVNDYYALTRRSSAIKSLCKTIRFEPLKSSEIKTALREIAKKEGFKIDEEALDHITERVGGDMRAAVNDLQSLAEGKTEVTHDDVVALGYRDVRKTIFESVRDILSSGSCRKSRESCMALDEAPDTLILWIDENLPLEYREPSDLCAGLDSLSKADVYLGRVRRKRHYRLWAYASDLMTCGVSVARKGSAYGQGRYRFPLWLSKMSRSRSVRRTLRSVSEKIGGETHTSSNLARTDILPGFTYIFLNDFEFRVSMTASLELTEREVSFLLGEKEDSTAVKQTVEQAKRIKEGGSVEIKEIEDFELDKEPGQRDLSQF
ncbi:MAG: replication factor C large subunit [Thermoplasmata archaeon]|nr:replication factor C large subunit [Thermoplasmata archaeon]